jgi:hypothetical protein
MIIIKIGQAVLHASGHAKDKQQKSNFSGLMLACRPGKKQQKKPVKKGNFKIPLTNDKSTSYK